MAEIEKERAIPTGILMTALAVALGLVFLGNRPGVGTWLAACVVMLFAALASTLWRRGVLLHARVAKLAERARSAEDDARVLAERVPVGLFRIDASGRLVEANPALARMLGHTSANDLLGVKARALLRDAGVDPPWMQTLKDGTPIVAAETRVRHQDGQGRFFLLDIAPEARSDGVGYVGAAQDVTRPRALLEQLRVAQRMEAVGRLASGVAHDFNNLLSVIGGNAELLIEDFDLEPEAREHLADVVEASRRGGALTRQLLTVGTREEGGERVEDVNQALQGLERLLERTLGADVRLVFDLEAQQRGVCIAPSQLDQIFLNLAVNARDAMPGGGELRIRTRQAEVSIEDARSLGVTPGTYVEIRVRDSGQGIPAEVRDHIFEPFFTTKHPGRGTGLGLSTVRGLVEGAGGFLELESEVDSFTEFTVSFPAASLPFATVGAPLTEPFVERRPEAATVLLIEDDEAVARILERILVEGGYDVLLARTPAEAFTRSGRAQRIDLVLSDVVLPGERADSLTARIREQHPDLAIVFTSGYSMEEVARRGVVRDHQPLLAKPFTREQVLGAVSAALATRGSGAVTDKVADR